MPEIKKHFAGGKMNKDVDERLVPLGEYRDAMNIQVSTSEGSDIGSLENLLGNSQIAIPFLLTGYECVGSISDEKTDSSYWFLRGPDLDFSPATTGTYGRDYIIRLKGSEVEIIFTDTKNIWSHTEMPVTFGGINTFDATNNIIYLPPNWSSELTVGDTFVGFLDMGTGDMVYVENSVIEKISLFIPSGAPEHIIVSNLPTGLSSHNEYGLIFKSSCLNFMGGDNSITGINIIDDLLFWTDNWNEPKMLNINRSREGTDQTGTHHTNLMNPELPGLGGKKVEPHHIQVIKRKPTKKLIVTEENARRRGVVYGHTTYQFSLNGQTAYEAGFEDTLIVNSGSTSGVHVNYNVGDVVLLLNQDDIDNGNKTLPHEYDVKIVIKSISHSGITSTIDFEIISVAATTLVISADYSTLLHQPSADLFEEEMFRFSYRYTYLDGEVSAFAPFSRVIFSGGEFKYNQKNAYNTGMLNNVVGITLSDFIDTSNTLNVKSIDLLVKNENSPNVYLVDTVKRSEFNQISPTAEGDPFVGTYEFNPKQIKATLPENQLLRLWDNVPRKALAQDVSGNRLIFGNYVESYNYNTVDLDIMPSASNRPLDLIQANDGGPSVKTQRNYQVGIVLLDKEGRESPIITNNKSHVTISKEMNSVNTMLTMANNSYLPDWVSSYKYYIKDSLFPTYNIVVDSFYISESGDYWLAIPSSERNKVQEGDMVELKKGINSVSALLDNLRTKIIAIENEAPDFIKTVYRRLGKSKHETLDASSNTIYLLPSSGFPAVGKDWFHIDKQIWLDQNDEGYGGGGDIGHYKDTAVKFEAAPTGTGAVGGVYKSRLYSCSTITVGGANYVMRLDDPIGEADEWIIDPAGNGDDLEPSLKIEIFEKTTTPSSVYHGKFFVKIEAREDLVSVIAAQDITSGYETILHKIPEYNFCDGFSPTNGYIDETADHTVTGALVDPVTYATGDVLKTDTYVHWRELLDYGNIGAGSPIPQYWIIDRMYYPAIQDPSDDPTPTRITNTPTRVGLGIFKGTAQHLQAPTGTNTVPFYAGPSGFVKEGHWYIEVSLVGMFSEVSWNNIGSDATNDSGWDIRWTQNGGANPVFSPENQEDAAHYLQLPGVKFKWEGSEEIFTIEDTHIERRYNHTTPMAAMDNAYEYADWLQNNQLGSAPNQDDVDEFAKITNRRLTFILDVGTKDPTAYGVDIQDPNTADTSNFKRMIFLEQNFNLSEGDALRTGNPAVFEVKGKEDEEKLDIYYEASDEIPINLTYQNLQRLVPIGSKVDYPGDKLFLEDSVVTEILDGVPSRIVINGNVLGNLAYPIWQDIVANGDKLRFITPSRDIISVKLQQVQAGTTPNPVLTPVSSTLGDSFTYGLAWSNCFSFRNGVESFYLKDDYNEKFFTKGVKASAALEKEYEETYKKSGLIYSGLFNSISDVNNLNQFIQAEKITKDLNPTYGSIQKLHARDTDLIVLCEDKVLKVLSNKDAVYNADGNTQLTATSNVLGQTIPFYGEFGISKNPESFASEAYRAYFTDRIRGTVMRLSKDGLTPISMHGMKDWFKENLARCNRLIGSYDDKKDEYNLTLKSNIISTQYNMSNITSFVTVLNGNTMATPIQGVQIGDTVVSNTPGFSYPDPTVIISVVNTGASLLITLSNDLMCDGPCDFSNGYSLNITFSGMREIVSQTSEGDPLVDVNTVTFREDVKGWVSFKSFSPEIAMSTANEYYSFLNGGLWQHHVEENTGGVVPRNTFYNIPASSSVNVILNDFPSSMKSFKTLKYEGSQANVNEFIEYNTFSDSGVNITGTLSDHEYYNLTPGGKRGWYVENIETNKQKGSIDEFIEKEGKWFNYIKGQDVVSNIDGNITSGFDTANFAIQGIGFSQASSIGSVLGCTDVSAFNYDVNADFDDGSCFPIIEGCTNPNADNFITLQNDVQVDVNTNNGSCLFSGCMDITAFNFNPNANVDDGSCIPVANGCIDPTAFNFDPLANTDDGSCIPFAFGCMDNWTVDGCGYGVTGACNYDPLANTDDNSCIYAVYGCMDDGYLTGVPYTSPYPGVTGGLYDPQATDDDGTCLYCGDATANNYDNAVDQFGNPFNDGCNWCDDTINLSATNATTTSVELVWDIPFASNSQAPGDYYLTITNTSDGSVFWQGTIVPIDVGNVYNYDTASAPNNIVLIAGSDYTFEVGIVCSNTSGITDTTSTSTLDILGCTDDGTQWNSGNLNPAGGEWGACNYDPLATLDDSTCTYACAGCTDPLYVQFCDTCYNGGPWTYSDPAACIDLIVLGCTDPLMFNYNPLATVDDGSCIPVVDGCTDDQLDNNGIYNNDPLSYAATNYDPLANTDDGSCIYSCPPLTQQTVGNIVRLNVNLLNTYYSLNIGGGGYPDAYEMYVDVVNAAGTTIYSNTTSPGVSSVQSNTTGYHKRDFSIFAAYPVGFGVQPGETSITVDWQIVTNQGPALCNDPGPSATYTIGCTDATADNVGSFDFTDNSQCTYTGCMDATLDNNGNYAAVGAGAFNPLATTPCNNGGGVNDCCTYNNTPGAELLYAGSSSGTTNYSGFYAMRFDFDATALQSATITAISVETTGQSYTSWNSYYIGGASSYQGNPSYSYIQYFAGTSNLTLGTGGTYDKDLLPLDFNNFDTATWVGLEHPTVNTLAHGIGNGDPVNLNIEYTVQWSGPIDNAYLGNQLSNTTTHSQTFTGGCKVGVAGQYTNLNTALQLHIPGSCIPLVGGCTDPAAFNYCSTCNADCSDDVGGTDMGCCIAVVDGCTDATAFNYDPAANTDDGSCCLPPCAVPGTLSAYFGGTGFVQLSYTDIPCADYYAIETCAGAGCTWTVLGYSTASNQNAPGSFFLDISSIATGIELQIRMNSVCVYTATGAGSNSAYTNTVVYNT